MEEAAETVRMIFTAYIGGHGLKTIAKMLNEQKRKTPALTQLGLLNKHTPNTQDGILKKYLWDGRMVGRILQDESYIGTLICHKKRAQQDQQDFPLHGTRGAVPARELLSAHCIQRDLGAGSGAAGGTKGAKCPGRSQPEHPAVWRPPSL